MTTESFTQSSPGRDSRRLQQAAQHVSQLWFPINDELFAKIKKGLDDGIYDLDVDFLLTELRTDFSLFTYCLKELCKMAEAEGAVYPKHATPMEILKLAGATRLKKILNVERGRISAHTLQSSSEIQTTKLHEAMLSASTAEVLAGRKKIDPALGFSTGLLRQLGYALVAWNYPTVYRRVLSGLKEGEQLDEALNVTLGFSPTMLATVLARQWKLSPQIRTAMGDQDAVVQVPHDTQNVTGTLHTICLVGEALARANDPEHYPSAESDWSFAKAEIEEALGYEGFGLIETRAKENCQNYLKIAPELFKRSLQLDPEAKIHQARERKVVHVNNYLKYLSPTLKKRFKDIYEEIENRAADKDTIRTIVREIIPLCGFTGCCIYTVDLENMRLMPRIKGGMLKLHQAAPLSYREQGISSDPVVGALKCSSPITEGSLNDDDSVQIIAAALGERQKVGVLYVEAPSQSDEEMRQKLLNAFKALRQTLCDCLGLQ